MPTDRDKDYVAQIDESLQKIHAHHGQLHEVDLCDPSPERNNIVSETNANKSLAATSVISSQMQSEPTTATTKSPLSDPTACEPVQKEPWLEATPTPAIASLPGTIDSTTPSTNQTATASPVTPNAGTVASPSRVTGTASTSICGAYPRVRRLPGSREKKIWFDLPVRYALWSASDYRRRFDLVVPELKRAVDEHNTLRDRARFIDYDMHMVGSSQTDAIPSIIIKCNEKDRFSLQGLFKEAQGLLHLYDGSNLFKRRRRSTRSRPELCIFYCASRTDPTSSGADTHITAVSPCSPSTFCGALLEYQGRRATVGLVLKIDGRDVLLTVEHLFTAHHSTEGILPIDGHLEDVEMGDLADKDDHHSYYNDSFGDDEDHKDMSYSEHDDYKTSCQPDVGTHVAASSSASLPDTTSSSSAHARSPDAGMTSCNLVAINKTGKQVVGSFALDPSCPFLNWACAVLDDESIASRRCNYIKPASSPEVMLENVAAYPNTKGADVYVVSELRGTWSGKLLEGHSYLGSWPGQSLSETMTIVADSAEGVLPGECGSIVVDQRTFEVYGHIIGSDLFGHGRVVPLSHTIDQIKIVFVATRVRLPTPPAISADVRVQEGVTDPIEQPKQINGELNKVYKVDDCLLRQLKPPGQFADTTKLPPASDSKAQRYSGSSSSESGVHSAARPRTKHNTTPRSKKYPEAPQDYDYERNALRRAYQDDDDDDDDEDNDDRRKRRPANKHNDKKEPMFACPFYKNDAQAHQICYKYRLKRIKDVKMHLERIHMMPPYCSRCKQTFKSQIECDEHSEIRPICKPQSAPVDTKGVITSDQHHELKRKRANRSTSHAEQWHYIYRLLFPGASLPVSPYMDTKFMFATEDWKDYLDHEWLPSVQNQLQEGVGVFATSEGDRAALNRVLLNGADLIRQRFQAQSDSPERTSRDREGFTTTQPLSTPTTSLVNSPFETAQSEGQNLPGNSISAGVNSEGPVQPGNHVQRTARTSWLEQVMQPTDQL